ncbi:MAG: hypothetical protein DDT20_01687 [Firmicutes bacterium]|nr:hypothetical protein [Bacillota bacterium]
MQLLLAVDLPNHRGQSSGFAAPGWAGDKNQSAWLARQFRDNGRQVKLAQIGYTGGDKAKCEGHGIALAVSVYAKAPDTGAAQGEVDVAVTDKLCPLLFGKELAHDPRGVLRP